MASTAGLGASVALRNGVRLQTAAEKMEVAKARERGETKMRFVTGGVQGAISNLETEISDLDKEVKEDALGLQDLKETLVRLDVRKADLERKIAKNEAWLEAFALDIGPFEELYAKMSGEIADLYVDAKRKHAGAINLLKRDFDYHPEYKRATDTFTGVPFKPK